MLKTRVKKIFGSLIGMFSKENRNFYFVRIGILISLAYTPIVLIIGLKDDLMTKNSILNKTIKHFSIVIPTSKDTLRKNKIRKDYYFEARNQVIRYIEKRSKIDSLEIVEKNEKKSLLSLYGLPKVRFISPSSSIHLFSQPLLFCCLLALHHCQRSNRKCKDGGLNLNSKKRSLAFWFSRFIPISLVLFFLVSILFRNFSKEQYASRVIYAYSNYIISPSIFWISVVYIVLFGSSVYVMTSQMSNYFRTDFDVTKEQLKSTHIDIYEIIHDYKNGFSTWIKSSALLNVGFLLYSYFYWKIFKDYGDFRYFFEGFVIHALWITLWLIVSYKFFCQMKLVDTVKFHFLYDHRKQHDVYLQLFPQSFFNDYRFIVTVVGTIIAFLFPLFK